MINQLLKKIFGTAHEREMKRLQPLVNKINAQEPLMAALTDDQLKGKTAEFKARVAKGETLDDILPEAFAVCREASKRVLGMRHYDVQLIGGIVLHSGSISEMKTGEGKTLVATLPIYLNALSGRGAHLITVNDYLVRRDAEWMGQLYHWLGLTTGIIVHDVSDRDRKLAYGADITYGTNNEFGFDYLRDNMKFSTEDMVQRPLNFAIVDECDSILIDEARTPLIISGPAEASTDKYYAVNAIIPKLVRDEHYVMEEKSKTASLTDEGNTKVEELLKIENLYDPKHIELLHHIYQGLKAHHLYKLDVDYMNKDGEIVIVDEFTGRLMPGRRWSDGLHQAIEAKEGVDVKNENQTLATITFQNYFRMYNKLAGMTGTADTEAVEFKKIYNLNVVVIPTNKQISRKDLEDVVYKNEKGKFKAIAQDIKQRYEKGQPILVGTVSIEKSETLSRYLKEEGVRHEVLNAKHHEREAEIIAQAGRKNAVTIATNMAGRGTDILLGGNPEMLAKKDSGESEGELFEVSKLKFKQSCELDKKAVIEAGGLYIIGTERHESRRIDNQLRGRAGRQGDPGESRFYLSLEDNLMRIFNGEMIQRVMDRLNVPDDEPIVSRMVSRSIEGAQRKVEGHNFDIRKHLLDFDNVMNQQRTIIYGMRRKILDNQEVDETTREMLSDVTSNLLETFASDNGRHEDWNLPGLQMALAQQFGVSVELPELADATSEKITKLVVDAVRTRFESQKQSLGPIFPQIQKMILLQSIDQYWKEHLLRIDRLKEGINLRGYGQKDPIIEYKKEAFKAFEELHGIIRAETLEKLFKIQMVDSNPAELAELADAAPDLSELKYSGADESTPQNFTRNSNVPLGPGPSGDPSGQAPTPERQRLRMSAGPPRGGEEQKLNRAQRRDNKKRR